MDVYTRGGLLGDLVFVSKTQYVRLLSGLPGC